MKPIIAVSLVNIFADSKPWSEAHKLWFYKVAHELNDETYFQWIEKGDYFEGIDQAMDEIMPEASEKVKTIEARKRFFESVIVNLKKEDSGSLEVINYFKKLKKNYRLALITTISSKFVRKILKILKMSDMFDIIETSLVEEKDEVGFVFERFLDKYGEPLIYVGTSENSLSYCKANKIKFVDYNEEGFSGVFEKLK